MIVLSPRSTALTGAGLLCRGFYYTARGAPRRACPSADAGLWRCVALAGGDATSAGLLPDDANARARAIAWMFAALSTAEPPIVERSMMTLLERDEVWYAERLSAVEDRVRTRLGELSRRLGDADWLDGAFSAGDLMMVTVLLRAKASGLLDEYPNVAAYVARGEARPAYKRAFADQLAVFTRSNPPAG